MELTHLSTVAGMISTVMFAGGTLPMLHKAWKTRDLRSYSFANLVLSNVGNAIHWIYVAGLPLGPIFLLHGFYTVSTITMLVWYLRQRRREVRAVPPPTQPRNLSLGR
jgi:uncharacterized protein with PQ loop repeat